MTNPMTMRVLGIDPGLQRTGYACVEADGPLRAKILDAGVVRLTRGADIASRLAELKRDLDAIFDEWQPNLLAVEQIFSHHRHVRTAIIMGHARGVVLLCGAERGVVLTEFSPSRIKQAVTGRGQATKREVQEAVAAQAGLTALPEPPDVADAIAIAMTALRRSDARPVEDGRCQGVPGGAGVAGAGVAATGRESDSIDPSFSRTMR